MESILEAFTIISIKGFFIQLIVSVILGLLLEKGSRLKAIRFTLKRWLAILCIAKIKRRKIKNKKKRNATYHINRILNPSADNPKIITDENSCDSVSFYGADQKGNSLLVKMNHRGYHTAELILQLTLSDGRVYVLPDYPDTITTEGTGQKWSASGLKIEILEPRQRWRIVYNGLLRNQSRGDVSNDTSVEHVRLNFIFIGNSQLIEWPDDWSIHLHADALANESWKSPNWINKIKLIDYTGFDQWGSLIGQITFNDSTAKELYFRGLCQRRWGKHESHQFRQIVRFFGVTMHGAMYYLGLGSTKHSFSQMQFGHIMDTKGTVSKIDWTNLKLNDFKKGDIVPINHRIIFTAAGKQYNAVINCTGNSTVCYNGQPWYWTYTTRNSSVHLNNSKGIGMMITCYPYTGPKKNKTPTAKIQYLTRSETFMQKDKYILHFADKQCQNENVVGGKGYSLAVLTSIITDDFTVPQGFCVTSFALERQLQHHKHLQDLIADIVDISRGKKKDDLRSYCKKAVCIIQSTSVEKEIAKAILEGLEKLDSSGENAQNRYAVRSSAVGEDSEETSAAGQNSTYLGVKSAKDVIKSVAKCWASLFSYQSVEYRRQNGLPVKAAMGVCVQRMIDAEAAGVMFTRHPTTGDPSSITITANYGLGETVVSGTVEPDTLTIHRKWDSTLIVDSSTLGNKAQKISMSDDGVFTSNLSEQETKKFSISDTTALQLAKIGLQLESVFGSARDVEWAVAGEQIFMLQARPITTLYAWTDFELMHELDGVVPADVDLTTFANVEEVIPHPMTPLSISTVLKLLNVSNAEKLGMYSVNTLNVVGMRVSMSYTFAFLRNVSKEMTMLDKILDVAICGRVIRTPEIHKVAVEKFGVANIWQSLYLMYDAFATVFTNEANVKSAIKISNKYTLDANKIVRARDLYNMINKNYREVVLMGKSHNSSTATSIIYQMLAMSSLTQGSENFTSEHLTDIAVLLSSCTNVISTEVPIALGKIAACIRQKGKAEEFSKIEPAKAKDWLKLHCPPAAEKLQNFFNVHGHRCIQELDFYAEPWVSKPDSIISTIQTIATSHEENHVKKTLSIKETIASLKTPLSSFTKLLLQFVIPRSRKAVMRREMTKNLIVAVIHKLRLAYKRLGALMVAESYIPDENLIFFLTHQEIRQVLKNHNPLLIRKALRRKRIHQQIKKLEYSEFSNGMPIPIQETLERSSYENCTKISGTSVCSGSKRGRACVITDLSEAKNIQHGDILITHSTDIGWSPYFPLLGGIVTELGGLISHGAVVAREYGLPCIVGATNATKIFQTGDTVLLAGNDGELIKLP